MAYVTSVHYAISNPFICTIIFYLKNMYHILIILIYFCPAARSMGYDFIFLGCSFGLAPNRGFLVCLGQKSVGYTNTYKETGVL